MVGCVSSGVCVCVFAGKVTFHPDLDEEIDFLHSYIEKQEVTEIRPSHLQSKHPGTTSAVTSRHKPSSLTDVCSYGVSRPVVPPCLQLLSTPRRMFRKTRRMSPHTRRTAQRAPLLGLGRPPPLPPARRPPSPGTRRWTAELVP